MDFTPSPQGERIRTESRFQLEKNPPRGWRGPRDLGRPNLRGKRELDASG